MKAKCEKCGLEFEYTQKDIEIVSVRTSQYFPDPYHTQYKYVQCPKCQYRHEIKPDKDINFQNAIGGIVGLGLMAGLLNSIFRDDKSEESDE